MAAAAAASSEEDVHVKNKQSHPIIQEFRQLPLGIYTVIIIHFLSLTKEANQQLKSR
jgi:hypothetical protein